MERPTPVAMMQPQGENDIWEMMHSTNIMPINNKEASVRRIQRQPADRPPPLMSTNSLLLILDSVSSAESLSTTPTEKPPAICDHYAEIERLTNYINELQTELAQWRANVKETTSKLARYRDNLAKAKVRLEEKGREVEHYKKQRERAVKLYLYLQARVREAYKSERFTLAVDKANVKEEELSRLATVYWGMVSNDLNQTQSSKPCSSKRVIDQIMETEPQRIITGSTLCDDSNTPTTLEMDYRSPKPEGDKKYGSPQVCMIIPRFTVQPVLLAENQWPSAGETNDPVDIQTLKVKIPERNRETSASSLRQDERTPTVYPSSSGSLALTPNGSSSDATSFLRDPRQTLRVDGTSVPIQTSAVDSEPQNLPGGTLCREDCGLTAIISEKSPTSGCRCW